MQQMIFIADFIACSTCFEQYYAHHQELESIIQMGMGMVLSETCWACNKICNKYHLLHLVGVLFPHKNSEFSIRVCYIYALVFSPKVTVIKFLKIFSWFVVVTETVRYFCAVRTQFLCTIQGNFTLKRPEHDSGGWPLASQPRGLWRTKWH